MYDIEFFRRTEDLKRRIIDGNVQPKEIAGIERQLDQLRSQSPTLFNIETTNYCNMTCVMCPRTTLMTRENQWIDPEVFEKVLDQIQPHDPIDLEGFWNFIEENYGITFEIPSENSFYFYVVSRCVILHGFGEPMVDKNIVDRIQACTNRNIPTYFSCVPSNINTRRGDDVMNAGLGVLKFSIDALDDAGMRAVRGKHSNFEKAYRSILDILELKAKKNYKTMIVPCMIEFAVDSQAREMHEQFLELWKGHDVFAYVKSQDNRWLYEEDSSMSNNSHYLDQYCEYPWTSTTVMADGSVVPCTQDYDCEMALGNVNNESLEDVWNGQKYKDFRSWHVSGDFPKGFKCVDRCDIPKLFERIKNHS
ncbi:MAG: hypothetical protein CL398_09890 [Acidiferrobacteraceae bacterium]|nr:hypothetical protein [Acidiferrobacteraceae bacterium]